MGFVFGLIGALAGAWFISEGRGFFGFLVGMMIGWLLHRLLDAQSTIRRLAERVDNLEQRNAAAGSTEKVARKTLETSPRVSLYEPTPPAPPPPPKAAPTPPEPIDEPKTAAASPKFVAPPSVAAERDTVVHERTPVPDRVPGMGEHTIEVAKRWLTTGNVPVNVGVIISFFGVSFLLKYAIEYTDFSITMSARYLAVAGFATA